MKKLLLIIAALLIIAGVALWASGNTTREIKTEINISAPTAAVWSILVDIDDWAAWSPIINHASGNVKLGSTLDITMVGEQTGEDGPQYNPVITVLDESGSLRWRAKILGGVVMTNDKEFVLEETSAGTRLTHKELFSGMMVPLFWSSVEKNVPAMLDSMNKALKQKAEANSG